MRKMIIWLFFIAKIVNSADYKPNFELRNITDKPYYFAIAHSTDNELSLLHMAYNLEKIAPQETIDKTFNEEDKGTMHMIISQYASGKEGKPFRLYTFNTQTADTPRKDIFVTLTSSNKNRFKIEPQKEDPMQKGKNQSGFSLANNIRNENFTSSEQSLYQVREPTFEFWNKSRLPVYIMLANDQPFNPLKSKTVEPNKRYFDYLNTNDYYFTISQNPQAIENTYYIQRKEDQPVFVRLAQDGKSLSVQKGKKRGLSGESQSGFSLKNNIKNKHIKKIK